MFTGIVEAIGTVTAIVDHGAQSQLTIVTPGWGDDLEYGESIAVNGVCLTVAKHLAMSGSPTSCASRERPRRLAFARAGRDA